jgi:hypothetical protein
MVIRFFLNEEKDQIIRIQLLNKKNLSTRYSKFAPNVTTEKKERKYEYQPSVMTVEA